MEALYRLFSGRMTLCTWVCLVATYAWILDRNHLVWLPACTTFMNELVIPVVFCLHAWINEL
jgi:hypothetical protein